MLRRRQARAIAEHVFETASAAGEGPPEASEPEPSAALGGLAGPELAVLVARLDPAGLDDAALVDAAAAWERLASWAAAGQLGVLAEVARRRPPDALFDKRDGWPAQHE